MRLHSDEFNRLSELLTKRYRALRRKHRSEAEALEALESEAPGMLNRLLSPYLQFPPNERIGLRRGPSSTILPDPKIWDVELEKV